MTAYEELVAALAGDIANAVNTAAHERAREGVAPGAVRGFVAEGVVRLDADEIGAIAARVATAALLRALRRNEGVRDALVVGFAIPLGYSLDALDALANLVPEEGERKPPIPWTDGTVPPAGYEDEWHAIQARKLGHVVPEEAS